MDGALLGAVLCVIRFAVPGAFAGEAAIQDLIKKLSDPDVEVRKRGGAAVAGQGAAAKEAIPALARRPRTKIVSSAWRPLPHWAKWGLSAMPALLEALKDTRPEERAAGARALRFMGPSARVPELAQGAVPLLVPLLKDPNNSVQAAAIAAVGAFGPAAEAALPILGELLAATPAAQEPFMKHAAYPPQRALIIEALEGLGAKAAPVLIKMLDQPSVEMRAVAAAALSKLGPAAQTPFRCSSRS